MNHNSPLDGLFLLEVLNDFLTKASVAYQPPDFSIHQRARLILFDRFNFGSIGHQMSF
jgi:hypothetical protein